MTRIGVLLPTREAVIYGDRTGDPRPLVALAEQAEALGFDSVWAGDSLLARPRAEPLALLAAVAGRTSRVQLGTAVLLASMRNPEQLAQAAATVDAVSSGRLILGLGAGPDTPGVRTDFALVGADFGRRASGVLAVARRLRTLWGADDSGDDGAGSGAAGGADGAGDGGARGADGAGDTSAGGADGAGDGGAGGGADRMYPLPVSPGGPALWYGGAGPKALERTGRFFDGWFPIVPAHEQFTAGWAAVQAAREAAGRPAGAVTGALYQTVVLGPAAEAEAQLAEHSELYYGVPHRVIARQQGSVAGDEEAVLAWLRPFIAAGAEHLCIRFGCADVAGQMERFAPLLAELRG